MKKLCTAITLSLPLLFSSQLTQAEALKVLSSWDSSYVQTQVVEQFMDKLKTASDGSMTLQMFGPETVPPFEQLDSATSGLMDMLYTSGSYHSNVTAIGVALDALYDSTPERLRSSGIWDFVDQHYQDEGLKLIAIFPDLNGYSFSLKEPLSEEGLKGKRIRGTPIYHGVIEHLDAAAVVLPGNEIYPALERGVIDGAGWPTVGPVSMRLYEVANYYMRPTLGQVAYVLFMNLDRWNALAPETQQLIANEAEAFEKEAVEIFLAAGEKESGILESNGMKKTELTQEQHSGVAKAWFDTATGFAKEKETAKIEEFKAIANKNGMIP